MQPTNTIATPHADSALKTLAATCYAVANVAQARALFTLRRVTRAAGVPLILALQPTVTVIGSSSCDLSASQIMQIKGAMLDSDASCSCEIPPFRLFISPKKAERQRKRAEWQKSEGGGDTQGYIGIIRF